MSRPDAIIIGGGIQGATMALAARRRGLQPMIVERGELGGGASGNSYGIIHGGLRYLQTLDVGRWKRSRRAQNWFLVRYPSFARPLPCVMPLYHGRLRCPATFRVAMTTERILTRTTGIESSLPSPEVVPRDAVESPYPVPRSGLTGAGVWHDAEIADVRGLIAAVVADAGVEGPSLRTNTDAHKVIVRGDRVVGLRMRDRHDGSVTEIETDTVIDCTGSWSTSWRPGTGGPSTAVLAFNLTLDLPCPGDAALAVSVVPGKGRSYFLRGQRGRTFAGTYYRPAPGAGEPNVDDRDVKSFVDELDASLPDVGFGKVRVHAVHAGLLPDTDGTGRDLLSTDHVSSAGPKGYVQVIGGKLTTAPLLSDDVATRLWGAERAP